MNADADVDWNALAKAWLDDPAPPRPDTHDIRARVLADSRRLSLAILGEYAIGALLVCIAAWQLATREGIDTFVWGFALLTFTGMALQFSSSNRRGLWRPASESTLAYLDLALERLRRRRRAVAFAWLLFGLETAFIVAWYALTWLFWPERTWPLLDRTPWVLGALGLATVLLVGWSVSVMQRVRAERLDLERLRAEISATG